LNGGTLPRACIFLFFSNFSSPPGLTRGSIILRKKFLRSLFEDVFAKSMDRRVKPGDDGGCTALADGAHA